MTFLTPYINANLKHPIWKLVIDPIERLLFAETRDAEDRQVYFSGFDLINGNNTFTNLTTDERWLTGMDNCYKGILFLHGYESAQSPVRKGITAIDGKSGTTAWSNYINAVHHISVNGPVTYNIQVQPQKLWLTDAATGNTLRSYNVSTDADLIPGIHAPHVSEELDEAFRPYIKGALTGNVHYIEYNDFRIVSLHAFNEPDLSQVIIIMQGENLVYQDLLNDKIQKLQPEAFIMHQNQLVYISNKTELKVLNL